MHVTSFQLSAPGERLHNEDCTRIFRRDDSHCFVLCDGLGGHFGGGQAARCVSDAVGRTFLLACLEPQIVTMEHAIWQAQTELAELQKEAGTGSGMKTTLCCLMLHGKEAVAAHVGDSRIYHFRDGRVAGRTLDHSVAQALVRAGKLSEQELRHSEDRSHLLRVMGDEWEEPQYELWQGLTPILPGDAFLLCSDGFWEWIMEADMERCLAETGESEPWLCRMEEWILRHGRGNGMDNYSAIAVTVS